MGGLLFLFIIHYKFHLYNCDGLSLSRLNVINFNNLITPPPDQSKCRVLLHYWPTHVTYTHSISTDCVETTKNYVLLLLHGLSINQFSAHCNLNENVVYSWSKEWIQPKKLFASTLIPRCSWSNSDSTHSILRTIQYLSSLFGLHEVVKI